MESDRSSALSRTGTAGSGGSAQSLARVRGGPFGDTNAPRTERSGRKVRPLRSFKERLVILPAAHDAEDRIIYDAVTGNIYYDGGGNGAGAQVLFAQVTAGLALTSAHFLVVVTADLRH